MLFLKPGKFLTSCRVVYPKLQMVVDYSLVTFCSNFVNLVVNLKLSKPLIIGTLQI